MGCAAVMAALMTTAAGTSAQDPIPPANGRAVPQKPAAPKTKPKADAGERGSDEAKAPSADGAGPADGKPAAGDEDEPAAGDEAAQTAAEADGPADGPVDETAEATDDEGDQAPVVADDEAAAESDDGAEQDVQVASAPSPDAPVQTPPANYTPFGPSQLEYVEGADIPAGYSKDTRIHKGLVIAGSVLFASSWLMSIQAAMIMEESEGDDANPLYAPIAGPFIAIGTLDAEGVGKALLFMDGLVQTAGLAMFIGGLAARDTVLVRTGGVSFSPTPGGLAAHGSF
jgi:hypothetical protein